MKKFITFILALAFAFSLNVGINAAEQGIKEEVTNETTIKRTKEVENKVGTSAYVGSSYKAITGGTREDFSGGYKKTQNIDGYTYVSYYKLVNGKIFNYKNSYSHIINDVRYSYTAEYLYDSTTCTQEAYGCITKYGTSYVIISEAYETKTTSGVPISYFKNKYSTKDYSGYLALFTESKSYYSNGKTKYRSLTYRNEAGNITKSISEGYYTNGKIGYRYTNYYDSKGNHKKSTYIDYTSKGKLSLKRTTNSNHYTVAREGKTYYKSGKVKTKFTFKYNGKSSYLTKSGKWYKYRTNGKKQYYKKQVYNKKGYITRMDTYSYNKKGQKKSNKYGNAYKYKTYFKSNSILIKKVTKAKYSKKGKLGSAYKVKATKLTKTYYY